jgi:hypothetical protein
MIVLQVYSIIHVFFFSEKIIMPSSRVPLEKYAYDTSWRPSSTIPPEGLLLRYLLKAFFYDIFYT